MLITLLGTYLSLSECTHRFCIDLKIDFIYEGYGKKDIKKDEAQEKIEQGSEWLIYKIFK